MPNWCHNVMMIEGTDAPAVLAAITGQNTVFDFNRIIPYPDEYIRLDQAAKEYEAAHPDDWTGRPTDGFNSGGYEWRVDYWGTKWNAEDPSIESADEVSAEIRLLTASFPPIPIVTRISEMFPDAGITLHFSEYMAAYRGCVAARAGELTWIEYDNQWNPFEECEPE